MTRTIFVVLASMAFVSSAAKAQNYGTYGIGSNPSSTYVQPYFNSHGTVTRGHHQTAPNATQLDNYLTRGNTNPYTGAVGTRTPRY